MAASAPLPSPAGSSTAALLAKAPAPLSAIETVDAAQALLGLMNASPTSTVPPEGLSPGWLRDSESRAKRRKRAFEMSADELLHARETNKRSAQQFRERERLRRMELKNKGETVQQTNEELKKEIHGLRATRKELAEEIRRSMPGSPLLMASSALGPASASAHAASPPGDGAGSGSGSGSAFSF